MQSQSQQQQLGKSNIRLALILGAVAVGFFLAGLYMATGGGS